MLFNTWLFRSRLRPLSHTSSVGIVVFLVYLPWVSRECQHSTPHCLNFPGRIRRDWASSLLLGSGHWNRVSIPSCVLVGVEGSSLSSTGTCRWRITGRGQPKWWLRFLTTTRLRAPPHQILGNLVYIRPCHTRKRVNWWEKKMSWKSKNFLSCLAFSFQFEWVPLQQHVVFQFERVQLAPRLSPVSRFSQFNICTNPDLIYPLSKNWFLSVLSVFRFFFQYAFAAVDLSGLLAHNTCTYWHTPTHVVLGHFSNCATPANQTEFLFFYLNTHRSVLENQKSCYPAAFNVRFSRSFFGWVWRTIATHSKHKKISHISRCHKKNALLPTLPRSPIHQIWVIETLYTVWDWKKIKKNPLGGIRTRGLPRIRVTL